MPFSRTQWIWRRRTLSANRTRRRLEMHKSRQRLRKISKKNMTLECRRCHKQWEDERFKSTCIYSTLCNDCTNKVLKEMRGELVD